MGKKVAAILLLAAALVMPTAPRAQLVRTVPLGFCSLPSLASATGLSSCSGGIPTSATYAVICAYVQNVNWRDDGVAPTASTGTGGQTISSGFCIPYTGTLTRFQAIQQVAGAILGVTFYSIPGMP